MRAWVGVVLVAVGCMPSRAQVSRGPWHALDTPHLHLETDLPLDVAAERSSVLEREVQQLRNLYTLLGARRPAPDLVRVVVFAKCDSEVSVVPPGVFGGRSADLDDVPLIRMCEDAAPSIGTRIRWQLAYELDRRVFGPIPDWLDAGLIEYIAGTRRDGDVVELGHPRRISLDDDSSFDDARRTPWRSTSAAFSASWKLVHAMLNTSAATREHALGFIAALGDGVTEAEAWEGHMRDVEGAVRDTYDRLKSGRYQVWKAWAAPEEDFEPTIRSLTPIEVAARLVDLEVRYATNYVDEGTSDAWNTLRRLDTSGDTALYWRAIVAYRTGSRVAGDARALFARYVEKRPDDARGHLGLLLAGLDEIAGDPQRLLDAEASVENAVTVATSAAGLEVIARYWRLRGKPEAARPFLERALERDRACARCHDTLAALLFDAGDAPGAVAAEQRAIASSIDGPTPAMTEALARYRAAPNAIR